MSMAVDVPGLVVVVCFFTVTLAVGIWGSWKAKKEQKICVGSESEIAITGGRNINALVGVFTMTATWVGAAYIMGTAESVYAPGQGVIWAFGPPAYFTNLFLGGLLFAKPMRSKRYVTMLDPFHQRYGNLFTTAISLPLMACDIIWIACILVGLGATMNVILGVSSALSIIISAALTITYSLLGGLYAVAYTDIVQFFFMFFSLWFCVPFVILSPAVPDVTQMSLNQTNGYSWMGKLELVDAGKWVDEMLILALGGLGYQSLHQRILSAASSAQAQVTCFVAAVVTFVIGIPSVIIGAVAASADWNQTAYGLPPPHERGEAGKILPLALQHLTPKWVSILGISSVAAAVLSSMDSVMLSSASMFTHNIYKGMLRKQASERELEHVIRVSILVAGLVGMGLSFANDSVLSLWLISTEPLYYFIFPQLICVLYLRCANIYGAVSGLVGGLLLRLLCGEPLLGIPPVLLFPGWREEDGVIIQSFPFRTLAMVTSLMCIIIISWLTELGFCRRIISKF